MRGLSVPSGIWGALGLSKEKAGGWLRTKLVRVLRGWRYIRSKWGKDVP